MQDQLLARSVELESVWRGREDSVPNLHASRRSAEDKLCGAILQSSQQCFEAVASRILRNCDTKEVQRVATKVHNFLR